MYANREGDDGIRGEADVRLESRLTPTDIPVSVIVQCR